MTSPTIAALRAEARPGTCIFCGAALPSALKPSGRARETCPSDACYRERQRVWMADKRAAHPPPPPLTRETGEGFVPLQPAGPSPAASKASNRLTGADFIPRQAAEAVTP